MGNDGMTMQEYTSRLQRLAGMAAEQIVVPAANEMLATVKNRIVLDGKNSNDATIGQYSTKYAYFGQQEFDRKSSFKPQGKSVKGKNAAGHKTMYLPQGYRQLRDIQGKPVDNIKVNYTGSTMAAYQQAKGDGAIFQGLTTEKAARIRKGQEAKRGQIFKPTVVELATFNKNVAQATKEIQIKILSGV